MKTVARQGWLLALFACFAITGGTIGCSPGASDEGAEASADLAKATLPPNYGTGGLSAGVRANLTSSALQPDGKVVVAGNDGDVVVVARFGTDGALDSSFGDAGVVRLSPKAARADDGNMLVRPIHGAFIALGEDGTISIATAIPLPAPVAFWLRSVATIRLLPSGTPDPTYANGTWALSTPDNYSARGCVIAADGGVLVAQEKSLKVLRFGTDGSYDAAFAGLGPLADQKSGLRSFPTGIAKGPGDTVVVGGGEIAYDDPAEYRKKGTSFARLRADGTLDPSFGSGGVDVFDVEGQDLGFSFKLAGFVVLPDASIIAAGSGTRIGGETNGVVVRFRADGSLDTAFGDKGFVAVDLAPQDRKEAKGKGVTRVYMDSLQALTVDSNGRILVVGQSDGAVAVARILPTGKVDAQFGKDGGFLIEQLRDTDTQKNTPKGIVTDTSGRAFLTVDRSGTATAVALKP